MTTALFVGLIGHPVGHSRSPVMQQAAFDALGIPARYELWDTPRDDLPRRIATLRAPGVLGANVTIPYKRVVLPLLDGVDPTALRQAGAVNCSVREESASGARLVGHNRDVAALRRVLHEEDAWRGARRQMLVLGAGGAARAALAVAQSEGAAVRIAARHTQQAHDALTWLWSTLGHDTSAPAEWLASALDLADTATLAAVLTDTSVLINATPVGTSDPNAIPLVPDLMRNLPSSSFVFDMVYAPAETALIRAARAFGLRASGGLPMLLYQGAEAFRMWTAHTAPLATMRTALGLQAETNAH